jgi:hypothetical protein
MMAADQNIRFVTYLSPSIPQALFEALADHVQRPRTRAGLAQGRVAGLGTAEGG